MRISSGIPILHLLGPKLSTFNAMWTRGALLERVKFLVFALLGLTFWVLIYLLTFFLLQKVASEELYGQFLMGKLLSFLAMIFFAVLVFSNMITSLSAFFLSEDLQIHFSSPVPLGRLFVARLIESMAASSWMVLLFAVPILIAYGKVFDAGLLYYPWMMFNLAALMLLPAALGAMIAMVLVKVFPARKLHDVLIIAAALLVIAMYLLFRFLQPEKLFNPDLFSGFAEYFATLRTPDTYFAPATWFAQSVLSVLKGSWADGLFYMGLLLSTGLFLGVVAQMLSDKIYAEAFSKAQEGRRLVLTGAGWFDGLTRTLVSPFSGQTRQLVLKDVKSFFRETTQWTQLLLLMGLVVVYLFNFKVLRLDRITGLTAYHINLVAFVNIVLATFVIAAVSVRFVLPMVSLEGQAIWIIRTGPVSVKRFLWSKYALSVIPLLVIAEVLIGVSNYFLGASALLYWVGAVTIFMLTLATTAMAIGVGAKYPNFYEQNIARLSTGASSIIFMVLAMLFVVGVIVIEFFPIRRLYLANVAGVSLPASAFAWVAAAFTAAAAACLFALFFSMRVGIRALEEMEL